MRKHWRAWVFAWLVAVATGLAWIAWNSAVFEPVYNGRTLAQYLDGESTNWPNTTNERTVEAIEAVYRMGPRVIPRLRRALRKINSPVERSLRYIQTNFPGSIARVLPRPKDLKYLKGLSSAAAQCLAVFGPEARRAIPDLIESLGGEMPVPNAAIYAISEIGLPPEHVARLLPLLNSTNGWVPIFAAEGLGMTGATNALVLDALAKSALTGQGWQRYSAIDALSKLGSNNLAVATALSRNLADPSALIRVRSAVALVEINAKSAPSASWFVAELKDEMGPGPRAPPAGGSGWRELDLQTLATTLGKLGDEARPAAPLLRTIKNDESLEMETRIIAGEALWKLVQESDGLEPIYLQALNTPDRDIRMLAAKGLAEYCVRQRTTLPALVEMISSHDSFARFYAARALWKLTGQPGPCIPILVAALSDHSTFHYNEEIRETAAETLAEMGPTAKSAVPALVATLSDVREKVGLAATNALKKIGLKTAPPR
jgi:HEAT repeat protein